MPDLNVTAAQALKAWDKYIGIGEHPPGSNRNAITAWYGYVGAWCAMALSKVLSDVGVLKAVLGHAMAYTVDVYNRGKAMGWLVSRTGKYEPGDIILFNFGDWHWGGRTLGIHHVGMAVVDLGGDMFACKEGNTGDDCKKRIRNKSNVAAVVRPPWAKSTPKPKAPPITSAGKDAMYRFIRHGRQFLTADLEEANLEQDRGAEYEFVAWIAPRELNTIPLHRFYDAKHDQHFYTTRRKEGDVAGFKYDGIVAYVSDSGTPIYRFRRGDGWFWTHDKNEGFKAKLKLDGATGLAFYINDKTSTPMPPPVTPPAPKKVNTTITDGNALTLAQVDALTRHIPDAAKTLGGQAALILAAAQRHKINVLLIFAIARHESHFGTDYLANPDSPFGKGHNMFGLDLGTHSYVPSGTPATGYLKTASGHKAAQFPRWSDSVNAMAWLIRTYYIDKGLTTVRTILDKYSPASDGNDPAGYTADVNKRMQEWADWLNAA